MVQTRSCFLHLFRVGTYNLCGRNPVPEVFRHVQDWVELQKSEGTVRILPL